jgi:hypothetical protein
MAFAAAAAATDSSTPVPIDRATRFFSRRAAS